MAYNNKYIMAEYKVKLDISFKNALNQYFVEVSVCDKNNNGVQLTKEKKVRLEALLIGY